MNFLNLSYFLVAAREQNITKAAERLVLSQQTLSNHIHRLEEELGTPLFERTPQLKLTYAGESFVKFSKQVLFLQEQFQAEIQEIKKDERGKITIGCTRTRAKLIVPQILPLFHELYPQISFDLKIVESRNIAQELLDGSIDVIICVHRTPKNSEIRTIKLCEDRFSLVVPPKIMRKLYPDNTQVIVDEFQKNGPNLIAFQNEHFLMSTQSRARELSEQLLGEAGIIPEILIETSSADLMMRLCHCGMGVSLCYELTARDANLALPAVLHSEPTYVFPVHHLTHEPTHVIIGYNKGRYISHAIQAFINTALACYGKPPITEY